MTQKWNEKRGTQVQKIYIYVFDYYVYNVNKKGIFPKFKLQPKPPFVSSTPFEKFLDPLPICHTISVQCQTVYNAF